MNNFILYVGYCGFVFIALGVVGIVFGGKKRNELCLFFLGLAGFCTGAVLVQTSNRNITELQLLVSLNIFLSGCIVGSSFNKLWPDRQSIAEHIKSFFRRKSLDA